MASIHLVVSRPFGSYTRGALITDKAEIAEVLAGANQHDVVRLVSKPEHDSGDFWRTDLELKERRDAAKAAKVRPVVAPVDASTVVAFKK